VNIHVLYVIEGLTRSGAEQALASMAPHWVGAGVRLDVAYFHDRPGLQGELTDAGARLFHLGAGGGRLGRIRLVRGLARRLRPQLIHTTLFEADVAGRVAGRLAGVTVVSSLVNLAYGPEQLAADPFLRRSRARAAHLADAFTARFVTRFHAISQPAAEIMGRRLRIPPGRIEVIPRGRDPERLGRRTPERRARVRAELGHPDGAPLVLAAARHEPQKGLDVLLEAMPAVAAAVLDVRLIVAGREGRQTEELRGIVDRHRLGGITRFLGERPDVPDLLCAADVWVEPSRWEGGPGAMLEAMAMEAPIVASDLDVYRGAVEDGRSASLVRPEDPGALAAAIVASLSDPAAAAQRARRARARFLERFTTEKVALEMLGLYGRALDGVSRRS
jgi:glycosyltransferase involved in cell wall biosynthesis